MSSMVNDLLFLAQSDGFKKKEFSRLDLGKITQNQVDSMKAYAEHKKIILKSDTGKEFFIKGNRSDLKRLLTNLMKNAIDYNKLGGSVNISLEKNKSQVILKIIDTGVGISKDNLSHIFDRFFKVDQAHMRESSGAGLGLAIIKEIVSEHNGKIEIQSQVGQGTQFLIYFPSV